MEAETLNANLIQLTATITDGDGDTASATADITGAFAFEDDGPSLTVVADANAGDSLGMELDETEGTDRANDSGETADGNTDDDGPGLGQVTTNVSGGLTSLFTTGGDFGSDGAGTTAGLLSFVGLPTNGDPVATTLSATDGGAIDLTYVSSTQIKGVDQDGHTVFTIEIVDMGGGVYQLQTTLLEAIDHGSDGNLFDANLALELADAGAVQLQYEVTRTDGDGDSVTVAEQIDLVTDSGSLISFDDDGPTLTVEAVANAADELVMELDETEGTDRENDSGETADGNTDDDGPGLGQVTTNVSGGLTSLFTTGGDFGSDGAGTTAGVLSFVGLPTNGDPVATTLSATDGGAIDLTYVSSTQIKGVDQDGHTVFTIDIVDMGGGVYQLQTTLLEAIDHGSDGNLFDANLALELADAGALQLQYEVTRTDGDGDTITVADQIDLVTDSGSLISFDDDGPTLTVEAVANAADELVMELDETEGTDRENDSGETADGNMDDDGPGLGQVTTNVSGGLTSLFTIGGDFGSDGGDSTVGDLTFVGFPSNGDGLATNLEATDGGAIELTLSVDGKTITGEDTDGHPVFTIQIIDLGGGNYQLQTTLFEAIDHGDDSNLHDSELDLLLDAAGAVQLQYEVTRTDGDGDTVTEADQIDIITNSGSIISFDDDGPIAKNDAFVQAGENANVTGNVLSNNGNGEDDFGSDGQDTPAVELVANSLSSTDTNGPGILTLNANGSFTYEPIDGEEGTVTFDYTITDGDGDTSQATVTITLSPDSTPTVESTTDLEVDEDGFAFANDDTTTPRNDETDSTESLTDGSGEAIVSFGDDVPADLLGSIVLVDTAGLDNQFQTLDGQNVTFALNSGDLVGTVNGGATEVIRIEITGATAGPAADEVTYSYSTTLSQPVKHVDGNVENSEFLTGVTFEVTDSDGDKAQGTFDVEVVDDVPSASDVTATPVLDDDAQSGGNLGGTGDVDNNATASGAAGALFTAGADGVQSISITGPSMTAIYVDGDGVATQEAVSWNAVTNADGSVTYTGSSASIATVAVLTVNVDGSYDYTQSAPVVSSASGTPGTEETDDFVFTVTVTDGDDDSDSSDLTIQINDDTPVASDVTATPVLDDDAQSGGNLGGTGDVDNNTTASGAAGALFTAGADGVQSISITGPSMTAIYVDGDGVATQEAVSWNAVTNADGSVTYTGSSASIATVAVLTVNVDGSYDYTQSAPVVSSASGTPGTEETDDFVFTVTVTDGDDDSDSSDLTIQINDDTPVASDVTATPVLDDDAQSGGNLGGTGDVDNNTTASGAAGALFTAGADGVQSISITGPSMTAIYVDGDGVATQEAVSWNAVTNADGSVTYTGSSASIATVAVLTVNVDGSYDYTQSAPVVSSASGTPGTEETDDFVFTVTVTDGDDDSDSSDLTIQINDDTPVASDVTATPVLDDDAQSGGNLGGTGDVDNNTTASGAAGALFTAGADGVQSISITGPSMTAIYVDGDGVATQEAVSWNAVTNADGSVTYTGSSASIATVAVLTVNVDGSYDYTQSAPVVSSASGTPGTEETDDFVFTVTVTDGDDDSDSSDLTIQINDDTPVASDVTATPVLDDDAQSGGNLGGTGDVDNNTTASGAAGALFTAGADGVQSISITGPSMTAIYVDGDGVATQEAVSWNAVTNADGSVTYTGSSASIATVAVLTVNVDGSYDYTQSAPVVSSASGTPGTEETDDFVFTVTVTDGDDDSDSSDLTIQINDDTPVASDVTATPVLDDDAQSGGNLGGTGDVDNNTTASGAAGALFTAGADGVQSISITGPSMTAIYVDGDGVATQEAVSWNAVTNADGSVTYTGSSASIATVAVLTVNVDGSYDYTQSAPVVSSASGTPGTEETDDFVFTVTVTDGDDDSDSSDLTIQINDDTPVASDVTATPVLDDDAQSGGNLGGTGDVDNNTTASGAAGALFTAGADGVQSISITGPSMTAIYVDGDGVATQEAVSWNAVTNADGSVTYTGSSASIATVAVLTVNVDGSYDYTQSAPVVSSASGTPGTEETDDFVFTVTVTDGDDDSDSSDLTIQINDDTPVASDVTATPVLDDDAQSGGNLGGTGDVDNNTTASGAAGALFTAGADGVQSISITGPSMTAIYVDGDGVATQEAVSWNAVTNADGSVTYTGSSASIATVAVLTVNVDGSYDYTQSAPVVSSASGTPGSEETDDFVFTVTVTDGDDDSDSSDLTIQINDDVPTNNSAIETVTVHEDALKFPTNLSQGNRENASQTTTAYITSSALAALVMFGADGAGAFTLNTSISGDTQLDSKGEDVMWNVNGSTIEGVAGVRVVFSIEEVANGTPEYDQAVVDGLIVDGDQLFRFELNDQIDHFPSGAGDSDTETLDIASAFVATDGDGDSVVLDAGLTVAIENDVPVFTLVNDGDGDGVVSLSALNPSVDTTYYGQFAEWDYGADEFQSITATGTNVSIASQSEGQIVLNLLENGDIVGVLTLNADGTDSLEVLHRDGETEFIPITDLSAVAGGPINPITVDPGTAADFNIVIRGSDGDANFLEADDQVNTSNQGWGVKGSSGQTLDTNESLRFSFVDDTNGTPYSVDDFRFAATGFTGGGGTSRTVTIRVYLDAALTQYDEVTLSTTSGAVLQVTSIDWSGAGGNASYISGNDIYGVEVINTGSGGYRVNGIEIGEQSNTPPADLDFDDIVVTITDGDNDTDTLSLDVHISGTTGDALTVEATAGTSGNDILNGTSGNDVLIGGAGNDTLDGGAGEDTLDGGAGNDILNGGASDDTLVGGFGEDTLAGGLGTDTLWGGELNGTGDGAVDTFVIDDATATDIIGDFEAGIDEVDLSALLTLALGTDVEGDGAAGGTPDYVHYNSVNGDLTVDQAGNAASGGGDVVANLGAGLGNETIKILFDDGAGGTGTDTV
ncbi:DUF5801 repeats-in-toxin domain-containing protein [Roseibium salinum]|uniref:DUF5801 repeats-in-toxin domain-containing protein n=1 Tax=Roseibium salinum TaxID=1604349 RepID=UPI003615A609